MHRHYLAVLSLMTTLSFGTSWQTVIEQKQALMDPRTHDIIWKQFHAADSNKAPTIAAPEIREIAIEEAHDKLVDIRSISNTRITMLSDSPDNKRFHAPIYNSGLPHGSKIRSQLYQRLEKMLVALDELGEPFGYKAGDISIKVFEGLRDLKTQEELFTYNEIKQQNPAMAVQEAEQETARWVSPYKNNIPVHSTGAAIDIRLWSNAARDFVDVGAFGVIWGKNSTAPTFSEACTDAQKTNRLYLLMAATKAGLINYTYEHWHLSCSDRYARYWQEDDPQKRAASCGSVDQRNV
jgi:hypothetical protein